MSTNTKSASNDAMQKLLLELAERVSASMGIVSVPVTLTFDDRKEQGIAVTLASTLKDGTPVTLTETVTRSHFASLTIDGRFSLLNTILRSFSHELRRLYPDPVQAGGIIITMMREVDEHLIEWTAFLAKQHMRAVLSKEATNG